MALQPQLRETSFQEIAPECLAFVATFCETLVAAFSQPNSAGASTQTNEQRKKLLEALAQVIHHLREPVVLAAALKGIEQRHQMYHVRPEQYPLMGAILLDTLAVLLVDQWNPARRDAWVLAYQAICALMKGEIPALA